MSRLGRREQLSLSKLVGAFENHVEGVYCRAKEARVEEKPDLCVSACRWGRGLDAV